MSEGDLSGMDKEVVEESVVAIDAVVASSNDGGVHGRRSGLPGGRTQVQSLHFILERAGTCQQSFFFWHFPPWMPPGRGVLSMFYCEEAPGQRQDTLKRLYLSASLGIPQCSPG